MYVLFPRLESMVQLHLNRKMKLLEKNRDRHVLSPSSVLVLPSFWIFSGPSFQAFVYLEINKKNGNRKQKGTVPLLLL